jgi:hypothetical protein
MKNKSYEFHIGLITLPIVQFRVVICDAEITYGIN